MQLLLQWGAWPCWGPLQLEGWPCFPWALRCFRPLPDLLLQVEAGWSAQLQAAGLAAGVP